MKKYETLKMEVILSQEDIVMASTMQDVVEDHALFEDLFE